MVASRPDLHTRPSSGAEKWHQLQYLRGNPGPTCGAASSLGQHYGTDAGCRIAWLAEAWTIMRHAPSVNKRKKQSTTYSLVLCYPTSMDDRLPCLGQAGMDPINDRWIAGEVPKQHRHRTWQQRCSSHSYPRNVGSMETPQRNCIL